MGCPHFSSVQSLSRVWLFATPWNAARQASLSITNSRPSSWWCHPAISSSVVPFSSCPQSLPASESSPMSQLFTWGGQSTGVSALAPFLPKNTQDWSPLEWTGWISLQSKGLSRVFSNTTVQKHQFFGDLPKTNRLETGQQTPSIQLPNLRNVNVYTYTVSWDLKWSLLNITSRVKVKVTQSCPTLCDPMGCSLLSSCPWILQTRILQWVAIPSSRSSSQPRDRTQVSCTADSLPAGPPGKPRPT